MTWEAVAAGAADALLSWILAPHQLPGPRHMGQGSLVLPFVIPLGTTISSSLLRVYLQPVSCTSLEKSKWWTTSGACNCPSLEFRHSDWVRSSSGSIFPLRQGLSPLTDRVVGGPAHAFTCLSSARDRAAGCQPRSPWQSAPVRPHRLLSRSQIVCLLLSPSILYFWGSGETGVQLWNPRYHAL